jgi:hypothetical protein
MRMPELWIRSLLPADGFALPLRLVFLGCRRALVGFDVNFNLSALFQLHLGAVFVSQGVLDSDFLIQRLGTVYVYLRLLWVAWVGWLDYFLHGSRLRSFCSRHGSPLPLQVRTTWLSVKLYSFGRTRHSKFGVR